MPPLFRRSRGRPPHPDILTPAEWRVVEEVRKGRTNPEIADALDLSPNTVKTHVSSALAKLGFAHRDQLATWEGRPAAAGRASSAATAWTALLGHRRIGPVATAAAGVLVVVAVGIAARAAVGSARGGAGAGAARTPSPAAALEPGVARPCKSPRWWPAKSPHP